MRRFIEVFRNDRRGATSVEYGMILLIIALGLVVAVRTLTPSLNAIFSSAAAPLN